MILTLNNAIDITEQNRNIKNIIVKKHEKFKSNYMYYFRFNEN